MGPQARAQMLSPARISSASLRDSISASRAAFFFGIRHDLDLAIWLQLLIVLHRCVELLLCDAEILKRSGLIRLLGGFLSHLVLLVGLLDSLVLCESALNSSKILAESASAD